MPKILLIEDNLDFARVLVMELQEEGYQVEHAADGEEGLSKALAGGYSLVIMDIAMPKLDGLEVLKRIRAANKALQIMMLTSRSEEIDTVVALKLGADDYVTKPFRLGELMARIEAQLRRAALAAEQGGAPASEPAAPSIGIFGPLVINFDSRTVTLNGAAVELTCREYDILAFLAQNAGRAFSREELLDALWSDSVADYSWSLTNLVLRIRNKIEQNAREPVLLKTVRGFGYRFATREELAAGPPA